MIATLVAGAAVALAPPTATVEAGHSFQRVDGLRIRSNAALGDLIAVFGTPSSCRRIRVEDGAIVWWYPLGVRVRVATLGAIPAGQTACTWDGMPIDHVRLTTRRWRTSLGLRVGDSVAKLRRLYPHAALHREGRGELVPAGSYWLVTNRSMCSIGVCSRRIVEVPRLVAAVRHGRVAFLVVPVGAQGE